MRRVAVAAVVVVEGLGPTFAPVRLLGRECKKKRESRKPETWAQSRVS